MVPAIFTPYVLRSIIFSPIRLVFKKLSCRRERLEATRAQETNGGHAVDGGSR